VPQDQYFIKRVLGVPGDKVLFDPPGVRVNGLLLPNPPFFARMTARTNGYGGYFAMGSHGVSTPVELKAGEFVVAGDNSANSLDSRYYGPIRRQQITSRAFFITSRTIGWASQNNAATASRWTACPPASSLE